ncbi:amidohydrolase [Streptomyces sp. BI20]|uniref:amidohydrolase n=1 Tax=Streptomyces sp. BI20 TaxID=3403460 RepID=UPI003C73E48E
MIETPPLVDAHGSGVLRVELGLGTFETELARGSAAAPAGSGVTHFDSRLGRAVLRWCPPVLGLEPHCPPARYLARRRELGPVEVNRRLLRACGIGVHLAVEDPRAAAGDLTDLDEFARAADAPVHRVVSLTGLVQRVAGDAAEVDEFLRRLETAVRAARRGALAFRIAARLDGGADPVARLELWDLLARVPEPPDRAQVRAAVARARVRGAGADAVVLRHAVRLAAETGLPLHLPVPAGREPAGIVPFLREAAGYGAPVVLIGGHPHHRQTADLAARFPKVHADVGACAARSGSGAAEVLAEMLDRAPFGKLLWAGDGGRLPEGRLVAAHGFRDALARVLGSWVAEGLWSRAEADRTAAALCAGNARRVHGGLDGERPARVPRQAGPVLAWPAPAPVRSPRH